MKQTSQSSVVTKFFAASSVLVEVSCNAIDSLVTAYFGQPNEKYSCAAFEKWTNGTQILDLTTRRPLDKYDLRTVNKARHGEFETKSLSVYLKYLVNNGVLPPAKYIVQVA